jgi:hypothetical protein
MRGKSLVGLTDRKCDGRPSRRPFAKKNPKKPQPSFSSAAGSNPMTNFQRIGATSNTQVGVDFERAALRALEAAGAATT